jgi:hypothetical protein
MSAHRGGALLAEHPVMALAAYGRDRAWAAAVFHAAQDRRLYFLASPGRRFFLRDFFV